VSSSPTDGLVPAEVDGRAMICRRLEMFPVECVVRGYLTGSGLVEYTADGTVCGVPLPEGLEDGSRLEAPIFTPAAKAEVGEHDENITYEQVAERLGMAAAEILRDLTVQVYGRAEEIARNRGVILADTKFEFGSDPETGQILLGDEVLTPDSSRFWDLKLWKPGGAQASFDKQYIRDWLASPESGWDRTGEPPALPAEVIVATQERYIEAYTRLTGQVIEL
jgi:phosphoribosylaminoimidazole-succinocarboxamide synthase